MATPHPSNVVDEGYPQPQRTVSPADSSPLHLNAYSNNTSFSPLSVAAPPTADSAANANASNGTACTAVVGIAGDSVTSAFSALGTKTPTAAIPVEKSLKEENIHGHIQRHDLGINSAREANLPEQQHDHVAAPPNDPKKGATMGYAHFAATLVCTMVGSGLILMPFCYDRLILFGTEGESSGGGKGFSYDVVTCRCLRHDNSTTNISSISSSLPLRIGSFSGEKNSPSRVFVEESDELLPSGRDEARESTTPLLPKGPQHPSDSAFLRTLLWNYAANTVLIIFAALLQLFTVYLTIAMSTAGWRLRGSNKSKSTGDDSNGNSTITGWVSAGSFRELIVAAAAFSHLLQHREKKQQREGKGKESEEAHAGETVVCNDAPFPLVCTRTVPLWSYLEDSEEESDDDDDKLDAHKDCQNNSPRVNAERSAIVPPPPREWEAAEDRQSDGLPPAHDGNTASPLVAPPVDDCETVISAYRYDASEAAALRLLAKQKRKWIRQHHVKNNNGMGGGGGDEQSLQCPPPPSLASQASLLSRLVDLSVGLSAVGCLVAFLQFTVGQLAALALLAGNGEVDSVRVTTEQSTVWGLGSLGGATSSLIGLLFPSVSSSSSFASSAAAPLSSSSQSSVRGGDETPFPGGITAGQVDSICLAAAAVVFGMCAVPKRLLRILRYSSWTGAALSGYLLVYSIVLGFGAPQWVGQPVAGVWEYDVRPSTASSSATTTVSEEVNPLLVYVYPPSAIPNASAEANKEAWPVLKTIFVMISVYVSLFSCQYSLPILVRELRRQAAKRLRRETECIKSGCGKKNEEKASGAGVAMGAGEEEGGLQIAAAGRTTSNAENKASVFSPVASLTVAAAAAIGLAFVVYVAVGVSGNVVMKVVENGLRADTCEASCAEAEATYMSAEAKSSLPQEDEKRRTFFAVGGSSGSFVSTVPMNIIGDAGEDSLRFVGHGSSNVEEEDIPRQPPAATASARRHMRKCLDNGDYVACIALMVHYQTRRGRVSGNDERTEMMGTSSSSSSPASSPPTAPFVFLIALRLMIVLHFWGAYPLFAVAGRKAFVSGLFGTSEDTAEERAKKRDGKKQKETAANCDPNQSRSSDYSSSSSASSSGRRITDVGSSSDAVGTTSSAVIVLDASHQSFATAAASSAGLGGLGSPRTEPSSGFAEEPQTVDAEHSPLLLPAVSTAAKLVGKQSPPPSSANNANNNATSSAFAVSVQGGGGGDEGTVSGDDDESRPLLTTVSTKEEGGLTPSSPIALLLSGKSGGTLVQRFLLRLGLIEPRRQCGVPTTTNAANEQEVACLNVHCSNPFEDSEAIITYSSSSPRPLNRFTLTTRALVARRLLLTAAIASIAALLTDAAPNTMSDVCSLNAALFASATAVSLPCWLFVSGLWWPCAKPARNGSAQHSGYASFSLEKARHFGAWVGLVAGLILTVTGVTSWILIHI